MNKSLNTTPELSQIPDRVPAPVHKLPTGTVTLVTDIEGSTRLVQELGHHTYSQMHGDHGKILRGVIAASDGVEVRTEGDSFFSSVLDSGSSPSSEVPCPPAH